MQSNLRIMIVDDEMVVRESLFQWFKHAGHRVDTAASGPEALQKLTDTAFDLLFVDIKMPGMDGIEVLTRVKSQYPETSVVIITAYGSIESAIGAMKAGAGDYLLKPFKPEQLALVMEKIVSQRKLSTEYNYLKNQLASKTRFENIIGDSDAMQPVYQRILQVAPSDAAVLITGETGVGKELVAKAVHAKSGRAAHPFIAINCGAIPDTLLESELFGHQPGAFSGATHMRRGYLEVASGGTLFLDEIGEISHKMQIDLLRVLEDKQVMRVGGREPVDVDFRLISATRRNAEQAVRDGCFRSDFFYRIHVLNIHIPPLRERKSDIPLLLDHFLQKYSQEMAKQVDHIAPQTRRRLMDYDWPGNVRELQNAVERAVVLAPSRTLQTSDFAFLRASAPAPAPLTLKAVERRHIARILTQCDWNITRAAGMLGINRVTLHKKIKRMDLRKEVSNHRAS